LRHPVPGQGQGAGNRVAPDPGGTACHGRIGARCPSDAAIIQRGSCPRGRDTGTARARRAADPRSPVSTAAGSPETTLRPADDHDRIASKLNDLVARRLFSAGLDLEAALGRVDEHHAAGRIQHAISELDLAIPDIRDMVFDSPRAGSPAAGTPG